MHQDCGPTPENSTELCKQIADEIGKSANGVRMVLGQLGVYVKKEAGTSTSSAKKEGEGTKRVSKESQLEELRKAITDAGAEVDEDILSKLTGKAASYFVKVLSA
ncbi:MAG: hypothetical protein KDC82_04705 [Bacteroidetes bacterium]|nr:hypothetical protein [Bacteroidota bacterium]